MQDREKQPLPFSGCLCQTEICSWLQSPYDGTPTYTFSYQRDTYVFSPETGVFTALPYPCDSLPPLSLYQTSTGLTTSTTPSPTSAVTLREEYGPNICDIPIPKFTELFAEHAVAPFFVFQIFCVALWCLDEYWYYSLFTLFMLVVFECTVVFQVRRRRVIPWLLTGQRLTRQEDDSSACAL